jgi:hypothetical protein
MYPESAKSLVFSGHLENIHLDQNESETAFHRTSFLRNKTQHFRVNPSAAYTIHNPIKTFAANIVNIATYGYCSGVRGIGALCQVL